MDIYQTLGFCYTTFCTVGMTYLFLLFAWKGIQEAIRNAEAGRLQASIDWNAGRNQRFDDEREMRRVREGIR